MIRAAVLLLLALAACAPAPRVETNRAPIDITFPPMERFRAASPGPALRPNSEIAEDILDLAFSLESGRALPVLTRFEGPITLRVQGPLPEAASRDLDDLLGRLRREAGIPITRITGGEARITLEAVPGEVLRRTVPDAACFVVPRISGFSQLAPARRTGALDWATLRTRERATIVLPADAPPQEIRDCLHEELAQALGPLNDLYRLPDSVFNDDNLHSVLTGFDMLVLRTLYSPSLRSGMSRGEVASRLPGLLAALNPAGQRGGGARASDTPQTYITALQTALGEGRSRGRRRAALAEARRIAAQSGWTDTRAGFVNYTSGRLALSEDDPAEALAYFRTAARLWGGSRLTEIQAAHVAVQLASFALAAGDAQTVIAITRPATSVARRHENAALMSLLMMLEAEALGQQGRLAEAEALRLDSLGFARYGFGSRAEVISRLNDIAALPPARLASKERSGT